MPLSPLWVGAGIALLVLAGVLALELSFGELRAFLRGAETRVDAEEYRFTLVLALLIGYLPAAYAYAVRGSRRTWEALRPVIRCTPAEFETLRDAAGLFSAAGLRRAGWIGLGVAVLIPFLVDFSLFVYRFDLESFYLPTAIHRVLLPIVGWLMGRNIHAMLADSTRLARAGRERLDVDLLDIEPLAPFTRHGLRNSLLFMGSFAILSLLVVDWGARPGLPFVISVSFLMAAGLGVVALVLPVRGAHAAIRRAKTEELAACNEAIRARRRASAGADAAGPELHELLAWRSFVESVREWPIDASTLTRFLLYLAIPMGSWLGGAMVERAVDAALG